MTGNQIEIDAEDTPFPIVHAKKIKELIRKNAKKTGLSPDLIQTIKNALPEEIT